MPVPVQMEAVMRKLQDRLSEAMTTIAVLEVQNEVLEAQLADIPDAVPLEADTPANGKSAK